jgi:SPP1 family predicted phage head-tail adaptor
MTCTNPCGNEKFMGQAKHRITIENQVLTGDDYGGGDVAWSSTTGGGGTYWAMMEPTSGREVFASEQLQSRVTHKITIRYNSNFANTKDFSKYRITFGSRIFNVRYVRNLDETMKFEGKEYQEILAEENGAIFA